MYYRPPSAHDLEQFEDDGFLVVTEVIDAEERQAFLQVGQDLALRPPEGVNDWDWRSGERVQQVTKSIV